jgi:membrane-associated phospholipid phosphatase
VKRGALGGLLDEAERLDLALYRAVARTRTPALDASLSRLSRAANYSRVSIAAALALATLGGSRGRLAAARGMASVGVTAIVVNAALKPLLRRRRPEGPARALIRMPRSRSFPSGHTAAAFAFATGAGRELPLAAPPLFALAGAVGYSRVHTGVHYPLDVVTGSLCGIALAEVTTVCIDRLSAPPTGSGSAGLRDVDQAAHDQQGSDDQREV